VGGCVTGYFIVPDQPDPFAATMSYDKTRSSSQNAQEFYENTKARIQKIQSHLASSPRGTRLKDKVCIITGVGSVKGIGYVKNRVRLLSCYLTCD
jgi:hypothetical protein